MISLRSLPFTFLLAVLAVGPGHAGKSDNSVRFAATEVLENADPYFNNARLGVIVGQHVWDTLIYRDPRTGEYKGQLSTAWKWVDDTTLEFDLRRGVRFHNGATFTADDVVYTLNFVANPENKVVNQQNVGWIERAEKLDEYKVRIITKKPFPAALEYLAYYIVIHPHAYYAAVGPKGMNEKPVGTGPFRVVEHALGKGLRLERNPSYFADSPKQQPAVDKVEIRYVPDRQTQTAELISGNTDFLMNVAVDQAEQLKALPTVRVQSGETSRIAFLQVDTTDRTRAVQVRDIRVRQAMFHAIDRAAMVRSLVGEGSRVLNSLCFPAQFGCTDDGVPRYDYDPVKAKRLLAEAGYPNGFEVDLYAYRERLQTEAMINYLRAVGIRANLRFLQYSAMRDQVRAGNAPISHQTWGTLVSDVSAMTPVFFKFSLDDVSRDPEVRDLLERGDSSIDPATRKQAYGEALLLVQERAYALPLFSLPTYYVTAEALSFEAPRDEMPRFWEMRWR
jgi:peptide/nickel transport system substrate-binding protein